MAPSTPAAYLQLPLRFEPAQHQASGGDAFVARGAGYAVSVSAARASLLLRDQPGAGPRTLRMSLVGGNGNARPNLRRPLPGVSNYLLGNDRRHWVTGVRGYGEIEYRGVYRGVDIVYYGNQQEREYDFVVAPGISPDAIALAFDGATRVSVNPDGDLVIATDSGNLVQHRPALYQEPATALRRDVVATSSGAMERLASVSASRSPICLWLSIRFQATPRTRWRKSGPRQQRGRRRGRNMIVAGADLFARLSGRQCPSAHRTAGSAFVTKLNQPATLSSAQHISTAAAVTRRKWRR